uniref:Protein-S-isoprenylcysteine O-methyltransferase n=1 Tax=Scapholeberis mucronata TaxID=202097 RepID=A0A4Y7NKS9_9CRUS|nr:EOG090X0CFU [Scapholeberis mucronata]SVE93851.1 EOG090X0CFU [Scapholeberis mucronata]
MPGVSNDGQIIEKTRPPCARVFQMGTVSVREEEERMGKNQGTVDNPYLSCVKALEEQNTRWRLKRCHVPGKVIYFPIPMRRESFSTILANFEHHGAVNENTNTHSRFLSYLISRKWCGKHHQIVWRSCFLGIALASGLKNSFLKDNQLFSFGWYMSVMSLFHFSEFFVTSIIRPNNLSPESFLLNHSKAYGMAALTSWLEYLVELWFFPGLKNLAWISAFGLFLCLGGEIFRKTAMLTAFHNFDHLIRICREEHHQLVTSGIYSLCRHPSYVGWFYWSIGTQVILCNPCCAIAYTIISWKFFHERIFEEEMTLLHFFGKGYVAYQSKVPTGLPLIKGYSAD